MVYLCCASARKDNDVKIMAKTNVIIRFMVIRIITLVIMSKVNLFSRVLHICFHSALLFCNLCECEVKVVVECEVCPHTHSIPEQI
jgi:hypothetical protein